MTTEYDLMIKNEDEARLMHREDMLMEITELICEVMAKEGVSRSELASRMGVSKSAVSQMLNGEGRNLTLNKLSDALFALGYSFVALPRRVDEVRAEYIPIRIRSVWSSENEQALMGAQARANEDYTVTRCDLKDFKQIAA